MTPLQSEQITIRHTTNADHKAWDSFVENHPKATPYHLIAWKTSVESAYAHKCYYLLAEQNSCIVGILPLVHIKPPFLSGSLCSLPFCDLGGILTTNDDAIAPLTAQAKLLAREHSNSKLHLRHSHDSTQGGDEDTPHATLEKVRMILSLPDSSALLLKSFKSKLRSQVKKSAKNGISYSQSSDASSLDAFYAVMQSNMRLLGSPVHSKQWFREILLNFDGKAHIGTVEYEGNIIGAAILLTVGQTVTVPWASTLAEFNKLSPNMGLYWGMLDFASNNNFKYFDFGRSSVNEGTYRFKKQWGATPVPLNWIDYNINGIIPTLSPNAATSNRYRELVATIWTKLPKPLTNILGPLLRRYISL